MKSEKENFRGVFEQRGAAAQKYSVQGGRKGASCFLTCTVPALEPGWAPAWAQSWVRARARLMARAKAQALAESKAQDPVDSGRVYLLVSLQPLDNVCQLGGAKSPYAAVRHDCWR